MLLWRTWGGCPTVQEDHVVRKISRIMSLTIRLVINKLELLEGFELGLAIRSNNVNNVASIAVGNVTRRFSLRRREVARSKMRTILTSTPCHGTVGG